MAIAKLNQVTYNDFKLLDTIDPEQFDTNNSDIVTKLDEVIDGVNADVTALATHKSSGDHDLRYYKRSELLPGEYVSIGTQSWIATEGQTLFTITDGSYPIGKRMLFVTIDGVLQPFNAYTETSSTSFTFTEGLSLNSNVFAFWYNNFSSQLATHAPDHAPAGADSLNAYYQRKYMIDVRDFGVVGDGVTDDTTAFQNAINAIRTEGKGVLYIPSATYQFDKLTTITLANNLTIIGDGESTILKGLYIETSNYNNIYISNLKIIDSNKPLQFTSCDNLTFKNIHVVGDSTETSPRGIEFYECDNTLVECCIFEEVQYGVYYHQGSNGVGNESTNGKVTNCTFEQNDTGMSYPAGVYLVGAIDMIVSDNYFHCPAASNQGYAVYSGDNTTQQAKNIVISNNVFYDSNYADVRIDRAFNLTITGNVSYNSSFLFYSNGIYTDVTTGLYSNNILIDGNVLDGTILCLLAGQTFGVTISNNTVKNISAYYGMYVNGTSIEAPCKDISITDNKFTNIGRTGIFLHGLVNSDVRHNTIIDCNVDNETSASSPRVKGIAVEVARDIRIYDNYTKNTNDTSGYARYCVGIDAGTSENIYYDNNKGKGLIVSTYYGHITTTPAKGTYIIGEKIPNVAPAAGGTEGWICTTTGTMGTLNSGATTGSITSGTNTLTVNAITGLIIGCYITIAGVTGVFRVTNISETTITLSANADATVTDAAVAFSAAVFKTYGTIEGA